MARLKPRLKVGVLISGRGSNLQALIEAAADPAYPAEIVLVISNRPEAPGIARPRRKRRDRASRHRAAEPRGFRDRGR